MLLQRLAIYHPLENLNDACEKMCKSQQGLSRHKNAKQVSAHSHAHSATEVRDVESMLTSLEMQINNIDSTPAKDLNEKEKNIVTYLSGYVFGILYKRIRRSKNQSDSTDQYLSLLLSCKSTSSEIRQDEKLVDARNRCGLHF